MLSLQKSSVVVPLVYWAAHKFKYFPQMFCKYELGFLRKFLRQGYLFIIHCLNSVFIANKSHLHRVRSSKLSNMLNIYLKGVTYKNWYIVDTKNVKMIKIKKEKKKKPLNTCMKTVFLHRRHMIHYFAQT